MKQTLALLLFLAVLLSLASCGLMPGKAEPSPSQEPSESPAASPSDAASPTPSESAAAEYLASEPTAAGLGKYLTQNAQSLGPADADLLLERLLLLQLDISKTLNLKIWDEPYMTALNETLGGVLDAGKLGDINDETVRADFQTAADSLMTMVRYEETPVFEPNWAALEALKEAFSDEAAEMVTYHSRFQGRYYFGDPYNFDLMAGDIAAVEALIQNTDNGFIRWQLKNLYVRQVGRILHGAEGEWLFQFSDGDAAATQRIESFAETYSGTNFGTICARMLEVRDDGPEALSAAIADRLYFPPGDSRKLTKEILDYNGAAVEFPRISGLEDEAVADKINAAISDYAKALAKPENNNQSVGYYLSFANDRYINFCFTYSYWNESDTGHFSEAYLTLDLETGNSVSLDDLAGKPFEAYQSALLEAMGSNAPAALTLPVNFLIDRNELAILVPSETSDWPDYYPVTWGGLRSFMDVSVLY
jgi:hypothetical protein